MGQGLKGQGLHFKYVTPILPHLLADYHYSNEIEYDEEMYRIHSTIGRDITAISLRSIDPKEVKQGSVIQCDVNCFSQFLQDVFPRIQVPIILITSQCHMPSIQRSTRTDRLLLHPNLILWISQNPIYHNVSNYIGIPYGIHHFSLTEYDSFFNRPLIRHRPRMLSNLQATVTKNLPVNHIRRRYPVFGHLSGRRLPYGDYLQKITESTFLFSPTGDRDDCHRHCEAIGLGCCPIANLDDHFKEMYRESCIYKSPEEMNELAHGRQNITFVPFTDQNLVTVSYWIQQINEKLKKIAPNENDLVLKGDSTCTQNHPKLVCSFSVCLLLLIFTCVCLCHLYHRQQT